MRLDEFHVLLIDDDQDDHFLIGDLLSDIPSAKYHLTCESNYASGLRALREGKFDVCLLDYRLGEKTGLDLLLEIESKAFPFPIILLTGLTDFEVDVRAMRTGVSDYLVKSQLTSLLLERSIRYSIKHRHDLDEIKESRAQIVQQDRLASLGLLASSLAHEIGTPLGVIRSRAEMAEKKLESVSPLHRDMGIIIAQIDRITKLVNSLLNLAREKKADHVSYISLNAVIQDVLELLQHEFKRKEIEFHNRIDTDLSVKAEPGPLGQVLINLLINSIHAIEEAKAQPTTVTHFQITLSAKNIGDRIEISVEDNGIGISEDNLQQIFKPFFTTKQLGQGTGLGLATSLGIVKSWGGDILVSSQNGTGSKFRLIFPRKI